MHDVASSRTPARAGLVPKLIVGAAAAATLLPGVSAGAALIAGIVLGLTVGNPWPARTPALARRALAWSVVGLGAGMNLAVVAHVGLQGLGYTAIGLSCAFVVGTLAGRLLAIGPDVSLLITVGTAICGGSAIAAVGPVIRAEDHDMSMALVAVFLLNAVALFLFPAIGHHLHLAQHAFGLWCALAIHDTSSVVAAAAQYGPRALAVATAGKLARALWIVPVTVGIAALRARETDDGTGTASRVKYPWFIAGFVAVSALVTFVPALSGSGHVVARLAQQALAATLFLMGLGLSRPMLRTLGARPFLHAVTLWFVLATTTLGAILLGWIH
ncbi:MAG: putative sulfate exporter family transporter [Acidobacteriota bacterium]|nr:putative sulfate exporter family transporter [Acidobacteriota bacterium]